MKIKINAWEDSLRFVLSEPTSFFFIWHIVFAKICGDFHHPHPHPTL
jgi:predicted metalloprotease with PDZ domain